MREAAAQILSDLSGIGRVFIQHDRLQFNVEDEIGLRHRKAILRCHCGDYGNEVRSIMTEDSSSALPLFGGIAGPLFQTKRFNVTRLSVTISSEDKNMKYFFIGSHINGIAEANPDGIGSIRTLVKSKGYKSSLNLWLLDISAANKANFKELSRDILDKNNPAAETLVILLSNSRHMPQIVDFLINVVKNGNEELTRRAINLLSQLLEDVSELERRYPDIKKLGKQLAELVLNVKTATNKGHLLKSMSEISAFRQRFEQLIPKVLKSADDSGKIKILEFLVGYGYTLAPLSEILTACLRSPNCEVAATAADVIVNNGDYLNCSIGDLLIVYQAAKCSERRLWSVVVLACESKDSATRKLALGEIQRAIGHEGIKSEDIEGYKFALQTRLRSNFEVAQALENIIRTSDSKAQSLALNIWREIRPKKGQEKILLELLQSSDSNFLSLVLGSVMSEDLVDAHVRARIQSLIEGGRNGTLRSAENALRRVREADLRKELVEWAARKIEMGDQQESTFDFLWHLIADSTRSEQLQFNIALK